VGCREWPGEIGFIFGSERHEGRVGVGPRITEDCDGRSVGPAGLSLRGFLWVLGFLCNGMGALARVLMPLGCIGYWGFRMAWGGEVLLSGCWRSLAPVRESDSGGSFDRKRRGEGTAFRGACHLAVGGNLAGGIWISLWRGIVGVERETGVGESLHRLIWIGKLRFGGWGGQKGGVAVGVKSFPRVSKRSGGRRSSVVVGREGGGDSWPV